MILVFKMYKFTRKQFFKSTSFLFLYLGFMPATLAAFTALNELSFGTVAVLNNGTESEITINVDNQYNVTNHLRVLTPGQRGEYVLSAYPPFTQLFISANVTLTETSSAVGSSEQFTLTSLTTAPSVTTDAAGTATIFVGGTLRTSGDGSGQYFDTDYSVKFDISINY